MATKTSTKTKAIPLSGKSAGLTATQAANEKAAQNIRFGVKPGSSVTYQTVERNSNGSYSPSGKARKETTPIASPIPATGLIPEPRIALPEAPKPVDPGVNIGANNIALAPSLGYTVDEKGMLIPPAQQPQAEDPNAGFADLFSQYMGQIEAPPSTGDIYAKEYKDARIKQKEQAVNNYTAQLNSIVAKSQADQLRLEGQGRGITDVIIGGQQAQINKEAAIAALPIQAQLAAAQGDLATAQQHVDKMFQIKSQDALAQYQWRGKVLDSVYNFATAAEQRRLDAVQLQENRKYTEQQDFLKTQRSLLSSALQQGAPESVISGISNASSFLDALTAAGQYGGDILERQIKQAQLRKLNEAPTTETKAPEVKSINGVDMQWNPQSGKWESIGAGTTPAKQAIADSATNTLTALSGIKTHSGLNSSVGPTAMARVALADRFGTKQDFIASVENVISQEALNSLINLKSKGGTLGALSDKELAILESTASKIGTWRQRDEDGNITGYNTSESAFKTEITRLEELTQKALQNALGYDPTYLPEQESTIIDLYLGTGETFNPSSYY